MIIYSKFHTDFRGYIFKAIGIMSLFLISKISTFLAYINCFLRNVHIGKSCDFYGFARFIRVPGSNIEIGRKCVFRSSSISNLIGINRKCSFASMTRNSTIIIGESSGFSGTVITASNRIEIGKNVLCGANTLITDFDWHSDRYPSNPEPVIIEDNVWLGINVVVLKGVRIGQNSIIGANSIVTKNIPANVIAAGNPCLVIKKI